LLMVGLLAAISAVTGSALLGTEGVKSIGLRSAPCTVSGGRP